MTESKLNKWIIEELHKLTWGEKKLMNSNKEDTNYKELNNKKKDKGDNNSNKKPKGKE